MKKKGFTLVELLAVIAILAILVIMALPAVLRMYRQSRINSFQNEVRSTYKTVQSQFLSDSILLESGQTIAYTNAGTNVSGANTTKSLDMTGNSNFKYLVMIDVDGKVKTIKATNGTYSYAKTGTDIKIEDIEVENGNGVSLDSDITDLILTESSSESEVKHVATCVQTGCTKTAVGTELIIADENFYVVSSDATNTVLLSKYDLKSDGNGSYMQNTSGTYNNNINVTFVNSSGIAYWDDYKYKWNSGWEKTNDTGGLISPYSDNGKAYCKAFNGTNCAYVYDENAVNIYPVVNSYSNKISTALGETVVGKLMSVEEAYALETSGSLGAEAIKDKNNTIYWLGSPEDEHSWWVIADQNPEDDWSGNRNAAIRPVIIISTSIL